MPDPPNTVEQARKNAFVAMPFTKALEHVYTKVIKPTLERYNYEARRGDEIKRIGVVIDQVYDSIKKADLIVCELTDPNPNVYYELGLAHALSKDPVMLSQNAAAIPFDTKHLRVIPYEDTNIGLIGLRDDLELFLSEGRHITDQSPIERAKKGFPLKLGEGELSVQRLALFSGTPEPTQYAVKFLGDHNDENSFDQIYNLAIAQDSSPDLRREAFTALFKIDPRKALPILILNGLHGQTEYLVRERVISLLGDYNQDQAFPESVTRAIKERSFHDAPKINNISDQLLAQLSDTSWGVRRMACEVLGKGKKRDAVLNQLQYMLADSEPLVKLAALEALEQLHKE